MLHIKQKLLSQKHFIPLLLFHLIFFVVLITNFSQGKFFIGWDALNPEFNFAVNFQRAFFSSWQENYGLGTLGGHGFGAVLPHVITTFLLSFIIPQASIRIVVTFLCYYMGGLGMYFLVQKVLRDIITEHAIFPLKNCIQLLALCASLFYLFNLGTVQIFYIQLEAFIFHFAGLPWMFLTLIILLEKNTRRSQFLFFIANFIFSVQAFIPSLFVSYVLSVSLFLIAFFFSRKNKVQSLQRLLLVVLLIFMSNAYWFLTFIYYTLFKSSDFLASYNNIISTPEFIAKNSKYGDISSMVFLKSFFLDGYQLGQLMFRQWISHYELTQIVILGVLFFSIACIGLFSTAFLFKNWKIRGFALIFIFFFSSLATNTPPFSFFIHILQTISPTYEQAFRTSFTKFGLGLAFSYSIFFSLGLLFFLYITSKVVKKKELLSKALFLVCIALLIFGLPIFRGQLLYNKLIIELPTSYIQVMDFFKSQPEGRIADFPQDCSEGWYSYKWGYFGSGFYWYGVHQPFLSRSFDVWSKNNENYYWEITQALKENNYKKVDDVLQKYDVKWVLYDTNALDCRSQTGLVYSKDFLSYLQQSKNYQIVKSIQSSTVDPIYIFRNTLNSSASFLNIKTNLPNIYPEYHWSDNDVAYHQQKDYISSNLYPTNFSYPFRSLFTKRNSTEKDFSSIIADTGITLSTHIPQNPSQTKIVIPSFKVLREKIGVAVTVRNLHDKTYGAFLTYLFPKIQIGEISAFNFQPTLKIGEFSSKDTNSFNIFINNWGSNKQSDQYISSFSPIANNVISITDKQDSPLFIWNSDQSAENQQILSQEIHVDVPIFSDPTLKIIFPKLVNLESGIVVDQKITSYIPESCNELIKSSNNTFELQRIDNPYIRMISLESKQCIHIFFSDIPTDQSYLLEIQSRQVKGNKLRVNVENQTHNLAIDTYIQTKSLGFEKNQFILPPSADKGKGYIVSLENDSLNQNKTINDVSSVAIWQIPYAFITSLKIENLPQNIADTRIQSNSVLTDIAHPNETYYTMHVQNLHSGSKKIFLELSQSYDTAWGGLLKDSDGFHALVHLKENNWANAWLMPEGEYDVILFYWPQLLSFAGYFLLVCTGIGFFIQWLVSRKKSKLR